MERMTNEEYHKHPAISKTQLDLFHHDQYGIDWQKKCPVDSEKIKTFDFGTAMHTICLEPHLLEKEFAVMPAFNLRTNAGKAEKAEWLLLNGGKKVLTSDEFAKLNLMYESIMAHPEARGLIEADGIAEGSWFWTDERTGVDCRCRPDKLVDDFLVDVKTTPELSKFHFSVDDYRYYVQDPFYCDGLIANGIDIKHMKFLVVQKSISCGRYPVEVITLETDVVEYGRMMYKRDLENYARYLDGHREPTKKLEMSYNFYQKMDNALGDVI